MDSSRPLTPTIGSTYSRLSQISEFASESEIDGAAVTRSRAGRMRDSTMSSSRWRLGWKSCVEIRPRKMPFGVPSSVTTAMSRSAACSRWASSPRVAVGLMLMSLYRKPALCRLTLLTISAWAVTGWLWWMKLMPPHWANAMAIRGEETACMMALVNGTAIRIGDVSPIRCRTIGALRSTLAGVHSSLVKLGTRRYSLRVRETSSRIFTRSPTPAAAHQTLPAGRRGLLRRQGRHVPARPRDPPVQFGVVEGLAGHQDPAAHRAAGDGEGAYARLGERVVISHSRIVRPPQMTSVPSTTARARSESRRLWVPAVFWQSADH